MNKKMNKKTVKRGLLPYLFIVIIVVGVLYVFNFLNHTTNVLTYNEFMENLNNGKVETINLVPRERAQTYEVTGRLSDYAKDEEYYAVLPKADSVVDKITDATSQHKIVLTTKADPESSTILLVLADLLPMILLLLLAFFFLNRQMAGNRSSMDFGKSKARLSDDKNKVTFKDVAGLKEEKEEVRELIDFLKNPKKFQKLGARIPKGVLLMGPPGTGKTLLARAVAGEANVPFYFISGSDFVELFVGVGASRVRDMFQQAKRNAPCLIFIDEIDAVGRQRGTGLGGGHDEREQTLNQLLTEMDGFGENTGIIIIAATNRPDVLDPALLRPGRFDRQVTVSLPDVKGREEILSVHAKNKKLASDVTLKNLAKRTPGFSGADLENLLNEAALLAVRRDKNAITMHEVDEATDRVLMGPAKVSHKYSEKDRRLVAYHEAGHAVIGLKLASASDVQKVTIIPRGSAGGYNMMVPSEEKLCSTKTDLLEQITGLLGGRVSEEIVFKEITTGAENDFSKATKIVRAMVTEYGMSDLGPLQLEQQEGATFLGRDYNKSRNFSEIVAHEIDQEMRKIINKCYDDAKKIIKDNRNLLDLIAETLLEYETLTKEQIDYLVEHKKMPEEDTDNLESMSLTSLRKMAKEKGVKNYSKMNKAEIIDELDKIKD
ncbi:MAG: ATP-dependent zinc metalloprotease FtsH [Bacilli bacterium]|nr:ATP-dependent zinc metalloprotease FtsH [Bacilli bacterium]